MSVLVVRVGDDDVDACSDWLFQLGATAIEERLTGDDPALVAGFDDDDAALAARSVLLERWPCRLESTGDEAAWRDAWLRWIEPVEVAGFVVHAPWHDPAPWGPDAQTISIDPGRAFGSGHHATTQLALEALRRHVRSTDRVLDVGCGTGILAIAAGKLGAAWVTGVDLDHDVLSQAAANLEANDVADHVMLSNDPIEALHSTGARFDLVVANIVIGDLRPLIPVLVGLAERLVVISGFLDEQFDRLLEGVEVNVLERTNRAGWGCAVMVPIF